MCVYKFYFSGLICTLSFIKGPTHASDGGEGMQAFGQTQIDGEGGSENVYDGRTSSFMNASLGFWEMQSYVSYGCISYKKSASIQYKTEGTFSERGMIRLSQT
jgi:hypothetical protein